MILHCIKDIAFHDGTYYVQIDTINKEIFVRNFTWNVIVDGEKKMISDLSISKNMPQNVPSIIILESKENLSYLIGKTRKTKLYLQKYDPKPQSNKITISQTNQKGTTVNRNEDRVLFISDTEKEKIESSNYNKNKSSRTQSFLADDVPVKKKKKWWLF